MTPKHIAEEPPTEKARATRTKLIDSAAQSFVERGYGAVSVRDLAERSDVTSGAIYGHFRSKADLLGEAVRMRLARDLEEHAGHPYDETDLADYLAHNFRDYRARTALRALLVEGAAAARVDADVRDLLHEVVVAKQHAWAALYRETFVRQDLDPDLDPEALMMFMWAAELGLGVLEALTIDPPKPHALARVVGRLVGSLRSGS